MVSENYPLVGNEKIAAILKALGRSGTPRIDGENLGSDEGTIKTVSESEAAGRCGHQPESIDGLSSTNGDHANRDDANQNNNSP